jgi:hypothetical protein
MRVDMDKLREMLKEKDPKAYDALFGSTIQTCKCGDTLSAMINGVPYCTKCGRIQVN